MKTLLIAAYEKELAPFRAAAAAGTLPAALGFAAIGVGAVNAAIGADALRRQLDADTAARVLLVGTAGSYNLERVPIGSVVIASSIALAASHGAVPDLAGGVLAPTWSLAQGIGAEVQSVRVLNTLGITIDAAHTLTAQGDVEHMEAYACMRAFVGSQHRVAILLGITNEVGSNGRTQWQANEAAAMAKVLQSAAKVLSA